MVVSTAVALAGGNYKFNVGLSGNALSCHLDPAQTPSPTDTLVIDLVLPSGVKLSSASVVDDANNDLKAAAAEPGSTRYLVSGAAGKTIVAKVVTDHGAATCDKLVVPAISKLAPASGEAATGDEAAAAWWRANGSTAVEALRRDWKARGMPADTTFLVHLPSGQPAWPRLGSLAEGVPIQIAVVSSQSTGFDVALKDCADVNRFRVEPVPKPDETAKQADLGPPGQHLLAPPLGLVAAGPVFECGAGTASYELSSGIGTDAKVLSTTQLVSRPVYSFALVTAIGFDTTISHDFAAIRAADGSNRVARDNGRVGPIVLAGAQWMVGGVDYAHMKWNNYVVNPFAAVDASAPLTGFVVGDSITLTGGLSLSIGVAVHRGTRLKGASVGEALGDAADVPKEDTWHDPRFGLYLGVTLDSNVYSALKGS